MKTWLAAIVACATLAAFAQPVAAASELSGRVLFSALPVPGATVTATRDSRSVTTTSGDDGTFRFAGLDEGTWSVRVDMRGFVTLTRAVTLPLIEPQPAFTLSMRRYEDIVASAPAAASVPEPQADLPDLSDLNAGLINGSVNNGAASPFAQPRAIGNNRPGLGARYTGMVSGVFGDSSWNARPFSFAGATASAPSYGDAQLGFTLGGPLKIPWLVQNGPQMLLGYQHGVVHNLTTRSALVPTVAERAGDFSQSAIAVRDPLTGLPFPGGVIPPERIAPQAIALLAYYPSPDGAAVRGGNFQKPLVTSTTQDHVQFATSKMVTRRTTLNGTFAYQRTAVDSIDLFDFSDADRQSSLTANLGWTRRISTRSSAQLRYQFARAATTVTPYFAGRANVSGDAGVAGNGQEPADWGPPTLAFPDVAGLSDVTYQHSHTASHSGGGDLLLKRGRHEMTIGGDARWNGVDVTSQGDPRGTLAFTGAATGEALADFLLGLPTTSTIALGNAGTRLRDSSYDAYATDNWRLSGLTLNLGVRWEYESPFTGASGPLTGGPRPDRRGLEPRLAASWRPVPASSLVVRGSYGIYRNLGVYRPLSLLLAQQPPYSRTFSVQNGPATPLTLANPFPSSVPSASTFAVDPGFRVGYVHTWQVSAQRDLPASLTVIAAYLGAKGSHLTQASLPNTYPAGADNPCPACPSGFVLVTSNGTSLRNAGQFTLRRRLHNGLTATAQYTIAKSTDDAATFSNTVLTPNALSIAQNWLDLDAERGPSSFDQRHLVSAQIQYTSGVGAAGGTLVDNRWGTLFKDWTIASQLTAGSGLPFTPVFFAAIGETGFVGVRPQLTGAPIAGAAAGAYANPAAFAAPPSGTWGNAGRDSIRGPAQFALDASVARVFRLNARFNLEGRVAATNVLNRVTFATIDAVVTSPQFGRATLANPMRRLQATLRLRF
jgi:hypothetical protein